MTVIILQMADLQRKHILNKYQLKSNSFKWLQQKLCSY